MTDRYFALFLGGWAIAVTAVALPSDAFAAEAQWIWATKEANKAAPPGTCHFRKTFELGEPEAGRIEIACDNRYVLRLNGQLVGASNNWQQLDRYDVAKLLVAGKNTIDVRSTNDDTAAGLAARVIVKAKGQAEQTHSTDASWEARLDVGKGWNPDALNASKASPVFVFGELGKAGPWGAGFKAGPIVQAAKRAKSEGPFELVDGDRVVFLGNTFIEREQAYGYLETALTIRWPDRNITFRNLGWSGDTVTGIARARFGNVDEGFRHLEEHVHAAKPTVIFVYYGTNEAFEGEAGLEKFEKDLAKLLEVLEATGARIVMMLPLFQENFGPPLPDPWEYNEKLKSYRQVLVDAAQQRGHLAIDLEENLWTHDERAANDWILTENGMHLSDEGYRTMGWALETELRLVSESRLVKLRPATPPNAAPVAQGTRLSDLKHTATGASFKAIDERLPYPRDAETITIEGLEPGIYELSIDGKAVWKVNHNWWTKGGIIDAGPQHDQVEALRKVICEKNELYFHRWRPQNETYLYLFRKHEQGNNAREIPQFDPLVEAKEQEIARLRKPVPHEYKLTRVDD